MTACCELLHVWQLAWGGPEEFTRNVMNKLPVCMNDEAIIKLAATFGWSDALMKVKPKKRQHAAVGTQDVQAALAALMAKAQGGPPAAEAAGAMPAPVQSDAVPVLQRQCKEPWLQRLLPLLHRRWKMVLLLHLLLPRRQLQRQARLMS